MSTPSASRPTTSPGSCAHSMPSASVSTCTGSNGAAGDGEAYELQERQPAPPLARALSAREGEVSRKSKKKRQRRVVPRLSWGTRILDFWAREVDVVVEISASRDHLALERTFLGYLRTGSVLSMTGVLVGQMFVLSQSADDSSKFGFHRIGKPLATAFFVLAIATVLLGAARAYRQQHAMIAGKAIVAGLELITIWTTVFLLMCVVFGFLIALDIVYEYGS